MNALHLEAHLELKEIWEDFRDDPEVWVAILTGAGDRAFSAGNDLKATAERTAAGTDVQGRERPPFGRITRDFDCPKPMIAAVNGVAVGGGLEMALACDIIVAADHARLGLPEPRVGLFAGAGGIHRLARQVPFKLAMGLLLTGRLIQADEAYRIGLVNEVVPLAELMPTAERWAAEILECSPLERPADEGVRLRRAAVQRRRGARARRGPARAAARVGGLRRGAEGVRGEAKAAVDRTLAEVSQAPSPERLRALLSPRSVAIVGASDRSGWSSGAFGELREPRVRRRLAPREPQRRRGARARGRHELRRDRRAGRPGDHARRRRARLRRRSRTSRPRASRTRSCSRPASARRASTASRAQQELVELCRELGVTCVGPNCLGFVNVVDRAPAWAGMMPVRLIPGARRDRLAERSDRPARSRRSRRRRTSASATSSRPATRRWSTRSRWPPPCSRTSACGRSRCSPSRFATRERFGRSPRVQPSSRSRS